MSAFKVSKKHINYIANFVNNKWYDYQNSYKHYHGIENINQIGQVLWDENVRSVNCRYIIEEEKSDKFTFTFSSERIDPVQTLKLLDSLEYQSCETDDYKETKAYKLLNFIRTIAIHSLPGYDEAEWCLD